MAWRMPAMRPGNPVRRVRRIAVATACCSDSSRCWLRTPSFTCCLQHRAKPLQRPIRCHRLNRRPASGPDHAALHTRLELLWHASAPIRRRADAFHLHPCRRAPTIACHRMRPGCRRTQAHFQRANRTTFAARFKAGSSCATHHHRLARHRCVARRGILQRLVRHSCLPQPACPSLPTPVPRADAR